MILSFKINGFPDLLAFYGNATFFFHCSFLSQGVGGGGSGAAAKFNLID